MKRKKIAITVSKNYHEELKLCITYNARNFDKWYIITQNDDHKTKDIIHASKEKNIELVKFPLVHSGDMDLPSFLEQYNKPMDEEDLIISRPWHSFKQKSKRQPLFEKGLAIRYVQKYLLKNVKEQDLIILLDTDIILPHDFSLKLDNYNFKQNTLYGCKRKEFLFLDDFLSGQNIFSSSPPWEVAAGFLQIYLGHHKDKLTKRTRTCAWVDWEFRCQFPDIEDLPFTVSHLGSDSLNWKGKKLQTFYIDKKSDKEKTKLKKIISKIKERTLEKKQKKEKEIMKSFKMPEFLIAGFQKCGTTALHEMLNSHPDIEMPKSHDPNQNPSEIDYFSGRHRLGKDWFLSHFPDDGKFYGHKSPNCTNNFPNKLMSKLSASRIFSEAPNMKIIFSLRDPVEREFSAFCHYKSKGWACAEKYNFLDFVKGNNPDKNIFFTDYNTCLEHYYNMFSYSQIHTIIQESLIANHEEEMQKLLNFLCVKNLNIKQLNWHSGNQLYDKENVEFPQEARDILIEKYTPIVNSVSKNYGIDISLWKNFN